MGIRTRRGRHGFVRSGRPRRSQWPALRAAAALLALAPATAVAAPETTITGQPSPGAHDGTAWFSFTSDTQGAMFECARDSGAYTQCVSPFKYQAVPDGSHTFRVRARDAVGAADASPATATWTVEPLTSIGMGTQFVKRGNYIWGEGFGKGSTSRFVANVDGGNSGDIDDDAVVFYQGSDSSGFAGRWYVAKATDPRNGLSPAGPAWKTGFGAGSDNQFVADVNGDKKADAVTFTKSAGDFSVALSSGTSFGTQRSWTSGHGKTSENQRVADVTGEGRADAVVIDNDTGNWSVRPSNGTSFDGGSVWISSFGQGATRRMLADVTGDGAADAIAYYENTTFFGPPGTWLVAPSCATASSPCASQGSRFGSPQLWAQGFGGPGARVLIGDVGGANAELPGDGKADAVIYYLQPDDNIAPGGDYWVWDRQMSDGTRFNKIDKAHWKTNHGSFSAVSTPLIGNMDGHLTDDANPTGYAATEDPVVFADDEGSGLTGRWKWLPAEGHQNLPETPVLNPAGELVGERYRPVGPGMWNSWQAPGANNQADTALAVQGWMPSEGRYDSFDASKADEHLRTFRDAQIDFVTTDQTNGLHSGADSVLNRSRLLCQRIGALRASDPNIPRFSTAIGDFGHATPKQVYDEAREVFNTFVNKPACGPVNAATGVSDGYQLLDGRPLLALYLEHNSSEHDYKKDFQDDTTDSDPDDGYLSNTAWVMNTFTVRWHKGNMDDDDPFFPSDWKKYMSGIFWDGSKPSSEIMHVLPGFDSSTGPKSLPRAISGGDQFYDVCGWQRVLAQSPRPDLVTISGFNGYDEQGAVGPTTNPPPSAGWKSGDYYWNLTTTANAKRKAGQIVSAPLDDPRCDHDG
jgi:hypothetical protein